MRWLKFRRNKNGSERAYVQPPGCKLVRLPNLPENHPDFIKAYSEAVESAPKAGISKLTPGTVAASIVAYQKSPKFGSLARSTREQQGREFGRLADKCGHVPVIQIAARHIRADLSELTPGAASNRLKAWRALLSVAVESGLIEHDPSRDVKKPKQSGRGHHTWTLDEIEAFRAFWPIGSAQRRLFELANWTGARRVDLVGLGWQMVGKNGWLSFCQHKTKHDVEIPLRELPQGCAGLEHDHGLLLDALRATGNRLLFVPAHDGRQRSGKALSAYFRHACDAAGLQKRCTLHGLRKARAARLAELGWSPHKIGAWTGHRTLSEIEHYTRDADRRWIIEGTKTGTSPDPRSQLKGKFK